MELYKSVYTVEKIYEYNKSDDIDKHVREMETRNYRVVSQSVLPLFLQKDNIRVFMKTVEEYGEPVKVKR